MRLRRTHHLFWQTTNNLSPSLSISHFYPAKISQKLSEYIELFPRINIHMHGLIWMCQDKAQTYWYAIHISCVNQICPRTHLCDQIYYVPTNCWEVHLYHIKQIFISQVTPPKNVLLNEGLIYFLIQSHLFEHFGWNIHLAVFHPLENFTKPLLYIWRNLLNLCNWIFSCPEAKAIDLHLLSATVDVAVSLHASSSGLIFTWINAFLSLRGIQDLVKRTQTYRHRINWAFTRISWIPKKRVDKWT